MCVCLCVDMVGSLMDVNHICAYVMKIVDIGCIYYENQRATGGMKRICGENQQYGFYGDGVYKFCMVWCNE